MEESELCWVEERLMSALWWFLIREDECAENGDKNGRLLLAARMGGNAGGAWKAVMPIATAVVA